MRGGKRRRVHVDLGRRTVAGKRGAGTTEKLRGLRELRGRVPFGQMCGAWSETGLSLEAPLWRTEK